MTTDRLKGIGGGWAGFLARRTWAYPETLDGEACEVFGTGLASWGAWAQVNAALYLAVAARWEDKWFAAGPRDYRDRAGRRAGARRLIRYALGYHTSGAFDGAGRSRWGGEPIPDDQPEGYNNWHSPIWTCFLAQAVFALGDRAGEPGIYRRLEEAVRHDAAVQLGLGRFNFSGSAGDLPGPGQTSRPESNAWKAALLTLARGMGVLADPAAGRELEDALWASSFAKPADASSRAQLAGRPLGELVIGSHLARSGVVIHHRFLHPCYMVFPLLSRVQAAGFCARLGIDYPAAAAHREAEVFARLAQFLHRGRLIYPAGKDWPRWAYGQAYLLPVLCHRMAAGDGDYTDAIHGLLDTLQRDAAAGHDHSLILHRFGRLLEEDPWQADRYETDAIASLAQAALILQPPAPAARGATAGKTGAGRAPQPPASVSGGYVEPLARTAVVHRDKALFAVSARSYAGPAQLTLAPRSHPHLLEWRGNGAMAVTLGGMGKRQKPDEVVEHAIEMNGEAGFAAELALAYGAGRFNRALVSGRLRAGVLPGIDRLFVDQRLDALGCPAVVEASLHTWRFAQSVHNRRQRTLTTEAGEQRIMADHEVDQTLTGRWVSVDSALCLSLPRRIDGAPPVGRWRLRQGPGTRDPALGAAWLELAVVLPAGGGERFTPGARLGRSPLIVSLGGQRVDYEADYESGGVRMVQASGPAWFLGEGPGARAV